MLPEAPLADNNVAVNTYPAALRKGENFSARVIAFRRDGFNGLIDVTTEGLPQGVTCKGTSIGPGQNASTLIFACAEDAPDGAFAFIKVVANPNLIIQDQSESDIQSSDIAEAESQDLAQVG